MGGLGGVEVHVNTGVLVRELDERFRVFAGVWGKIFGVCGDRSSLQVRRGQAGRGVNHFLLTSLGFLFDAIGLDCGRSPERPVPSCF